jgi:hypothetical protein
MWQVKNAAPWARKIAIQSLLLAGTTAMSLALQPAASAQISVGVGFGAAPPVCSYGYYNYSPYGCAPSGYYGQGYFYNGIFLGVGPWSNWGYGHGWGGHRFDGPHGGRYVVGARGYRTQAGYTEHGGHGSYAAHSGHAVAHENVHGNAPRNGTHAPAHNAGHAAAPHGGDEHHK